MAAGRGTQTCSSVLLTMRSFLQSQLTLVLKAVCAHTVRRVVVILDQCEVLATQSRRFMGRVRNLELKINEIKARLEG